MRVSGKGENGVNNAFNSLHFRICHSQVVRQASLLYLLRHSRSCRPCPFRRRSSQPCSSPEIQIPKGKKKKEIKGEKEQITNVIIRLPTRLKSKIFENKTFFYISNKSSLIK
jgi:hypothetical protein